MENGYSPLHVACQEGHTDICELLIDSGASVKLKNKVSKTVFFCFQPDLLCLHAN